MKIIILKILYYIYKIYLLNFEIINIDIIYYIEIYTYYIIIIILLLLYYYYIYKYISIKF